MPIYDYQCPKCKYIRAELRNFSDTNLQEAVNSCKLCDIAMLKILSPTPGYVRGTSTPTKVK